MHDVTTSQGEPIRDSEGLLVTGLPKMYELTCTCGWSAQVDNADDAIRVGNAHRALP